METKIDYLRLSVTDRCNLNCVYCTPLEKSRFLVRSEILTHEELARAAAAFVGAGVRKIRLTGGEPLIKKGLVELVGMLRGIKGLEELAMTTNGVFLKNAAARLRSAGLDRVNISLNTLKKERFRAVTGSDVFGEVWRGVKKAEACFSRVKLNVILMKGVNDDEMHDFARLTVERPLTVRFIEYFPANNRSGKLAGALVKSEEVKAGIAARFGALTELPQVKGAGPARRYKLKGAKGELGFISNRTENFCSVCNRMRMDCAGKIYPCLFSESTHELRTLLRKGAGTEAVAEHIKKVFLIKSGYRKDNAPARNLEMSHIGG